MLGAAEPLPDLQRLLEEGAGFVIEAELGMDAAQGVEEPGAQERLVAELGVEALDAPSQELPGVRRLPPGLPWIGGAEQLLQEARRGVGPRCLLLSLLVGGEGELLLPP